MQKIKLKNNNEIANINAINSYSEMVGENDRRETLTIIVSNNTIELLDNIMFSDSSVLDKISIYSEEEELQGIHERYNIPCSMTKNLINNTIEVKVARKSTLEQQILETQLALAELGQIIGEVK